MNASRKYADMQNDVRSLSGTPSGSLLHKINTDAALLKALREKKLPAGPKALLAVPGQGKYWKQHEDDFSICEDQEFVGRLLAMCTVEGSSGLSKVSKCLPLPSAIAAGKADPDARFQPRCTARSSTLALQIFTIFQSRLTSLAHGLMISRWGFEQCAHNGVSFSSASSCFNIISLGRTLRWGVEWVIVLWQICDMTT